jgi:hypothetical protein
MARRRRIGLPLLLALWFCGSAQAATYTFKVSSAAQNLPAITTAGSYIFVDVLQDPQSANTVFFRFTSRIPQTVSGIGRLVFDTGGDKGLIVSMSVRQQFGAKMSPTAPATHPYTGNLTPSFAFVPEEGPLYNPNRIHPGDMVTIAAVLGPGRSLTDILNALNQGISSDPVVAKRGLRIGVIVYHLLGKRPDPKKTIMDDAGFLTSRLVAQ